METEMQAQVEGVGSGSYGKVCAPEWVWSLWAVVLLFVNCMTFPFGAQYKWPPEQAGGQLIAEFSGAVLAAFCLWRSAKTVVSWRVFYGFMLAGALAFIAIPMETHLWEWSDYPWVSAIPIALGVLAGAWFAHQRWLLIALPAFLGWWFWGALQSPTAVLPVVQTSRGVTVRLSDVRRNGCKVRIIDNKHAGKDFVDTEALRVEASAGANIPLWSVNPYLGSVERDYSLMHSAPSWVRNLNVTVSIPVFASKPLVSAQVPFGDSDSADVTQTSDGDFIRIKDMHWLNAHKDLGMTITLSVPDAGWTQNDYRISDDQGRDVELTLSQFSWDDKEITFKGEADGLSPRTKWIRVDLFSAAQMAANRIVFKFNRVPIG